MLMSILCLPTLIVSNSKSKIDCTDPVDRASSDHDSTNDINSPDLTIISTEVAMNVDVNSVSANVIVSNLSQKLIALTL